MYVCILPFSALGTLWQFQFCRIFPNDVNVANAKGCFLAQLLAREYDLCVCVSVYVVESMGVRVRVCDIFELPPELQFSYRKLQYIPPSR